tara:strand:- start:26 stop:532 length:507 start_codon:yes stop_codon:yes gene_type:complete
MKKILSLLIICLIVSCSQNRYHVNEITKPTDGLYYLKNDMSLVNGIIYNKFGDVGLFKNGIKNGVHKIWYENGQLKYQGNYINGKPDGVYKSWYKNGQLKMEVDYRNGKKDGLVKTWYKNGQLETETEYKNDKKDGLEYIWFENGKLKWVWDIKNGEKKLTRPRKKIQ